MAGAVDLEAHFRALGEPGEAKWFALQRLDADTKRWKTVNGPSRERWWHVTRHDPGDVARALPVPPGSRLAILWSGDDKRSPIGRGVPFEAPSSPPPKAPSAEVPIARRRVGFPTIKTADTQLPVPERDPDLKRFTYMFHLIDVHSSRVIDTMRLQADAAVAAERERAREAIERERQRSDETLRMMQMHLTAQGQMQTQRADWYQARANERVLDAQAEAVRAQEEAAETHELVEELRDRLEDLSDDERPDVIEKLGTLFERLLKSELGPVLVKRAQSALLSAK